MDIVEFFFLSVLVLVGCPLLWLLLWLWPNKGKRLKFAKSVFGYIFLTGVALLTIEMSGIAYRTAFPTIDRFKITIKFETPEGVKTGSSVIELVGFQTQEERSRWLWFEIGCGDTPCPAGPAGRVRGVAPIVDLGKHGRIIGSLINMVGYLGGMPKGTGPFAANPPFLVWVKHGARSLADVKAVTPNGIRKRHVVEIPMVEVLGSEFRYVETVVTRTVRKHMPSSGAQFDWLNNLYEPVSKNSKYFRLRRSGAHPTTDSALSLLLVVQSE